MALLADDDVVVDHDPEILGRPDDLLGHLEIGAGRRRIARGVIVHEHDRRGRKLERPPCRRAPPPQQP